MLEEIHQEPEAIKATFENVNDTADAIIDRFLPESAREGTPFTMCRTLR